MAQCGRTHGQGQGSRSQRRRRPAFSLPGLARLRSSPTCLGCRPGAPRRLCLRPLGAWSSRD
eukprot:1144309-Alexandrium_andersonii.AAC.1